MAGRPSRATRAGRPATGQHFLRSRALAAALVDDARVTRGDLVVDVGAGSGILTGAVARRAGDVWAVELDPGLAAGLARRFARTPTVRVLEADASTLAWPRRPFKVVANLPFAAGTAILRSVLDDPAVPLTSAAVILQWEAAAKRAAVWPSTLLGVYWGAWYRLSLVRRLPRCAFAPPPAVDAGVLSVTRRGEPLVAPGDARVYLRFLRRGFDGRRPLRRTLPARSFKRLALELGFAPDARARDLDAAQWAALFRAVRSAR